MSWPTPRCILAVAICLLPQSPLVAQDAPKLRDQATVRLTFEEADGAALDSATAGDSKDDGTLNGDPARVSSPFWNATGHALQLDLARQQYVELADAVDLDRPDAVSFSLLAVNLLEANDGAYHGLVAKRGQQDGKVFTNYGINFTMQADTFQVYINDGRGYRVVQYSTKAAFPPRKLLHLTATFQLADAPGQDADTDVDDIRVQLFVNGQPITPKSVTNGFVEGNAGWITDVEAAGLVNNLPVTIGRSEAGGEYFHGIVDEFLLFPTALSPEQARQLFLEVAGDNVDELIKLDSAAPAKLPELVRLSQSGLQVGQSTQAALVGKNLLPEPKVVIPMTGVHAEIVGESKDDRLTVKFTVDAGARPGIYPLYLQTANGMSDPLPIAIDILPHVAAQNVTAEKPANLPVAVFGALAGGQEPRAYFQGVKGQRIVADLELKRLGGKSSPVLELKTQAGTPLTIAWGTPQLDGDVRIEHVLPADGLYYVELHDLVYRAPGPNNYRLKLGDLKLVDIPFPVAGAAGALSLEPVGTGVGTAWSTEVIAPANSRWAPLTFPAEAGIAGPWPYLKLTGGVEVVESPQPAGQWQTIDSTLADPAAPAVAINGRLLEKGEQDTYLLTVTPSQKLNFLLESQSLDSPIAGEIEVLSHPQGNRLAISGDQPSDVDPTLNVNVPDGVTQLRVVIRDLLGRGTPRSVYRLVLAPSGRPEFSLSLSNETVQLPDQGSTVIELTVARAGYTGPIALHVAGDAGVDIEPATVPAGVTGKILCRLQRGPEAPADPPIFKIEGRAIDLQPPVVRYASRARSGVMPAYADLLARGATPSAGIGLDIENPPTQIFKGAPLTVRVRMKRSTDDEAAKLPLRISSRSTEATRQKQPNNPAAGTFPLVAVAPATMVPPGVEEYDARLEVPLDVADPALEFVLVGEALPHAYSERVLATAVSQPFRVSVQAAVAPKLTVAAHSLVSETEYALEGQLQRTAGFTAPVQVALVGLPAGYQAAPVEVAGDQNDFRLLITAPAVTAETPLAGVKLRVTTGGAPLAAEMDINIKTVPKS